MNSDNVGTDGASGASSPLKLGERRPPADAHRFRSDGGRTNERAFILPVCATDGHLGLMSAEKRPPSCQNTTSWFRSKVSVYVPLNYRCKRNDAFICFRGRQEHLCTSRKRSFPFFPFRIFIPVNSMRQEQPDGKDSNTGAL